MQNQKAKLFYNIIMLCFGLFAMLQQSYVFSKTYSHNNKLTFKRQVFTMSKANRIALSTIGAIITPISPPFGSSMLAVASSMVKYKNDIQISFTENDHCVTHKQPYEGVLSNKNILSVRSGRKDSIEVAQCFLKWFKDKGAATFNRRPSTLNFAVKGRLTITVPVKDGRREIFFFDDMMLAQGHKGAANNWWIGGVNCTVKRKSVIACLPEDYEYNKSTFCFNRPVGYISTIHIVSCNRSY